ncbi:hypothetical protein MNBD_GAMMA12-2408 [hydrothermal vent metagenome]|uniref:Uncharacterized protein n=1 Tax=hydrothermal vent metagenome TaxID=652676 RepID=A0A3B0YN99_9ZZZZ
MRHIQLLTLCILAVFSGTLFASVNTPITTKNSVTTIKDSRTATSILGKHPIHYQVEKRSYPSLLRITNSNGKYSLQTEPVKPSVKLIKPRNTYSLQGNISEIHSDYFKFIGNITTQLNSDNQNKCTQRGIFYFSYFKATGKPAKWRLLQNRHTCANKPVIVEFSANPEWKPRPTSKKLSLWGIGMITKNLRTDRGNFRILFPEQGITNLYDKPNGQKVAAININLYKEKFMPAGLTTRQIKYYRNIFGTLLIHRNNSVSKINIHPQDMIKVKSNYYVIKVYQVKDNYLQILPSSMKHKAWVSIKDLAKQGFQYSSWRDYILNHQSKSFTPSGKIALNVRLHSNAQSDKVTLVKGKRFKIKLTGQTNGAWMKVAVSQLSKNCRKTIEKWQGWIKTLDDTGYPNIQIRSGSRNRC